MPTVAGPCPAVVYLPRLKPGRSPAGGPHSFFMDAIESHTKRKRYDAITYARLLDTMTQLMEDVPKLRPNREAWDIEGDWSATGTIHFVDTAYQSLFDAVADFDCRTIKFVNMGKPAVRLTFYRKHRYWLLRDKDLPLDKKIDQLKAYIGELMVKYEVLAGKLPGLSPIKQSEAYGQLGFYSQQISQWREILNDPQRYEIAISNYNRLHSYVTVNYKYRLPSGDFTNEQEHLLNTQRDRLGNISQVRHNILFVDPVEILRDHPYQNREVEGFLNTFPIKSETGKQTIYARPKPDEDALAAFRACLKMLDHAAYV